MNEDIKRNMIERSSYALRFARTRTGLEVFPGDVQRHLDTLSREEQANEIGKFTCDSIMLGCIIDKLYQEGKSQGEVAEWLSERGVTAHFIEAWLRDYRFRPAADIAA